MKEKVIKINYVSLGISGFAFLLMLFFSTRLPFTANTTAVISYITLFLTCTSQLYYAFKDNEHPLQAMRHSFNYVLDKMMK